MDILNLPGLSVVSVNDTETADTYYITAVSSNPIDCCHSCGCITKNNVHLSKFGTRKFVYMDIPIHCKLVIIGVVRQRYKCHSCDSTFFEELPDMARDRMMTKRLVEYIWKQSLDETFATVAARTGIDEKTVRSIFKAYVADLDKYFVFTAPRWLGIDEIHMIGKPRCVLTDLENHTIIDMLPDRNLTTLRSYFWKTKSKRRIEYCYGYVVWLPHNRWRNRS